DDDSYGPAIMRKVQAYADVAERLTDIISFDVIHAHDWITYTAGVRLKNKTEKPLLVHVHSLETDRAHPQARNQTYYIEHEGMMNADRVLPVSEYTKHSITEYYGIDASKIFPVYNAIEMENVFHEARTDHEKRVLFLGRITRQKGPKFLFETMTKLCRKMNNVKFYIAGTGDQAEVLKREVEAAGIAHQVVFTGFVRKDKVNHLFASVDAYFMPSVSEPFGLSALEAALFNIPCVISKQSGVSEVLHNVLKADCWDTDKLANYLYAVLNYESLCETMTRLTADDVKNISWDSSAREALKSYKHVLNRENDEDGMEESTQL
ncbi:MAG: glycosyltransferase family 4 protein, partial [Chitinophagales bacterium]